MGFTKSIKNVITNGVSGFDRTAAVGLVLLVISLCLGVITRNSAYLTNTHTRFYVCDSYISWLCIPTLYISIPIVFSGGYSLVLNLTSFLSTAILFILGIVFVRNRGTGRKPGRKAKPGTGRGNAIGRIGARWRRPGGA
jgi:hypothetical protein